MIRKLIFLPLIFLFISCTVTKRVHRPGFHVQWRKIERSQSPEKQIPISKVEKEVDPKISKQEIASTFKKHSSIDSSFVKLDEKFDHFEAEIFLQPEKTELTKKPIESVEKTEKSPLQTERKTKISTKKAAQSSTRPIFWRMSSKSLKSLGNLFIFLGILILIGSFLTFAGAFTGGQSGAWANFFLDLIAISEWFWILVFILIIVLLVYISVILVRDVFGGPLTGLIIGLPLLALGIFFRNLGKNREIEP